jgi:hypothetical protein
VERVRAYLISALLLGAVAAPGFRDPSSDAYPLSTYPMFSQRRGRIHEVTSARAVSADASEVRVPPSYVANAETMQAVRTLSSAVRAGEGEALALCRAIAQRLADAREPGLSHAVRVELVTERVDAIAYLSGHTEPLARQVHASCPAGAGL